MESIKEIYKIGYGPSSSHTMGPAKAAIIFRERNINAFRFTVELFGSLAMTGRGHLTDKAIINVLGDNTEVIFNYEYNYSYHPNAMKFKSYDNNGNVLDEWLVFSIGGGALKEENEKLDKAKDIYPHNTMSEILKYCNKNDITLIDYIRSFEDSDLDNYLELIFNQMASSIDEGIHATGILPGELKLNRKASEMYQKYLETKEKESLLFAYTLAVSEVNASGGKIVTAPTCGSAGVVPGVLFTEYKLGHYSKKQIKEALAIAGLICDIVKTNGSISGAEVGCQGEVGVACAAASAALTYLRGGNIFYIEYSAEIALEHHLGMTCDPIYGLVQIPCIERNAMASGFANYASSYALKTNSDHYVKLDSVISVMMETGKDIHSKYRETSVGGLALRKKKL